MVSRSSAASLLLLLAACGGGSPTPKLPVDEQPPAVADGLVVEIINEEDVLECARHDLAVRVMVAGEVKAEQTFTGECHGACTEEDKAAGEAAIAEIEAGIATGDRSESELDYNFTSCEFYGVELARWEDVGGRKLAVLMGHSTGPHDIPNAYYHLAAEHCGAVWLSEGFGQTYANRWSAEDLGLTEDNGLIQVWVNEGDQGHELYRAQFPPDACSGAPEETVSDAELE